MIAFERLLCYRCDVAYDCRSVGVIVRDESRLRNGRRAETKLAAIEAEWERNLRPAAFILFGIPDQEGDEQICDPVRIPYALGIIGTRSVDIQLLSWKELMVQHRRTHFVTG